MTTPPDFRALIADDAYAMSFQSLGQYRTALLAALAQPEPQGVTDEEICSFITRVWPHAPGNVHDSEWRADMLTMIRAAIEELSLIRWARPTSSP